MDQDEVLRLLKKLTTGTPKEKAEVEKALREWLKDRRDKKINS
jgi:hypothetical protein